MSACELSISAYELAVPPGTARVATNWRSIAPGAGRRVRPKINGTAPSARVPHRAGSSCTACAHPCHSWCGRVVRPQSWKALKALGVRTRAILYSRRPYAQVPRKGGTVSQPPPACPDCKVPMDSGFIVDFTYGTDASEQASWAKGPAERSSWTGLKLGGKERLPILTFRCPECGQLKSFAQAT